MYIRKLPSGSYRVEVERSGQRVSKAFPTKREAQAWGNEIEGSLRMKASGWPSLARTAQARPRSSISAPG
jgi:hypothetical protein